MAIAATDAVVDLSEEFNLGEMLANRAWVRGSEPFPHIRAQNVFKPRVYRALAHAFGRLLARGFSDRPGTGRFARGMPGYDAYGINFGRDLTGPFCLFTSRTWRDLFAALMGVDVTDHVMCGLHHHPVGSKSGRVHNDLNPGWFVDYESASGIVLARHDLVNYGTGQIRAEGAIPREDVRAVAILFYFANPKWSPGDGGETGLYRCATEDLLQPEAAIPPINNTLLAFECTPYSFHSFITNRRKPRNCMIMWLHRSKEDAVAQFGEPSIVPWR